MRTRVDFTRAAIRPPVVLCLLAFSALVIAAPSARTQTTPPDPLRGDRRLARTVTVERGHIFLGELLEQLRRDSLVHLSVDDQLGAVDGIMLTAYITERPLREVMTGLSTLFTTRFDRWEWRVADRGFRLHHQRAPAAAAAAARAALKATWIEDLHTFREIARQSGAARQAAIDAHRHLVPKGAEHYLDLFSQLDDEQYRVLIAGQDVSLDLNALPPAAIAGVDRLRQAHPTGANQRPPAFRLRWDREFLGPVLWMSDGSGSWFNAMGGIIWDNRWLGTNSAEWRTGGDRDAYEFSRRARIEPGLGRRAKAGRWADLMLELREAHQIDILADFVYPRHDTFANGWIGADAEKSLLALSYPDRVAWRQSEGLYLVRDPRAELETRAHLVPWREVAAMRQAAQHNDGFLPFDALLKLADWSAPQVVGLALEFPNLGEISHWKPILQFVNGLTPASRARLQSERGLPWNDAGQTSKRLLLEGAEGDLRAALDRHLLPQPQNVSLRLIRAGQAAAPRQRPGVPRQEARVRITMTLQASIAGEETSRPLGGLLRLPEWKPLSPW